MARDGTKGGRQAGAGAARHLWGEAAGGEDHAALRAYLKARGIDVAALPRGCVPECLRYMPVCPYWVQAEGPDGGMQSVQLEDGPAFIARVDGEDGKIKTIHRTYLDVGGEPKKRTGVTPAGDPVEARKLLGSARGGAVRLADPGPDGILFLTEGIETGLAVLASLPGAGVWACIATTFLQLVDLPPGWVDEREGRISTVIIAGDCDRSDGGRVAAIKAAARIRARWPNLEVGIAIPGPAEAPTLFTPEGMLPKGAKGVDWLDVLNAAGAAAVKAGVCGDKVFRAAPEKVLSETDPGALAEAKKDGQAKAAADKLVLPRGDLERARVGLGSMFAPGRPEHRRWRLARWGGAWWVYTERDRCWKEISEERLRAALHHFYNPLQTYGKGGQTMNFAPTARAIDGIRNCMVTDTFVPGDAMPCWLAPTHDERGKAIEGVASLLEAGSAEEAIKAGSVLAFRNGLLDADAWCQGRVELIPHSPRWFSRSCLPYELPVEQLREAMGDDADMEELCRGLCPTWLKFLETVTADLEEGQRAAWIRCLRQWFGYLLTHDNSLDAILAIIGPGRSGKGTILSMIEAVVGKEACAWTSLNDLANRFEMSSLVGKGVAIISDAHIGKYTDPVLATERAKTISGGDSVPVEEKYKAKTSFLPTCRLVICANELPKLPDPSGALASRLTVLTMTRSFAGKEDRALKPRVLQEAAGVMVWALGGLRDLRKEKKFVVTQDGADTLKEFALLNSPVMAFVQEVVIVQEGSSVVCKAMYKAYQNWAQESGHTPLAAERFGAQLKAVCPAMRKMDKVVHGVRAWSYQGVRPLEQGESREQPRPPRHIDQVRGDDPEPYLPG